MRASLKQTDGKEQFSARGASLCKDRLAGLRNLGRLERNSGEETQVQLEKMPGSADHTGS